MERSLLWEVWVVNSLLFMEPKGLVLCSQVLVLSSHLWLGVPSDPFTSDIDQNFLGSSLSPVHPTYPTGFILVGLLTLIIFGEQ